ncbi:MAG: alpha/beta hydrolase [Muriicola sp.]|nr:alpha/beta hydrolase [Muriicola sp.]
MKNEQNIYHNMKCLGLRNSSILLISALAITTISTCQTKVDVEKQLQNISYDIKRDSVWITTSNGRIFGLLLQPVKYKLDKIPAVLCLQGGGDVGLANYIYEAEVFAKKGISALVCDKSGSGLSKTEKSWREQSFKDKTTEYMELHAWLSSQERIDKSKVGVHGMSEGGRLALNMAIRSPDKIAFVNVVSGPIASFKENRLFAIQHHLSAQGFKHGDIDQVLKVWEMYYNDVAKGLFTDETLTEIKRLRETLPTLRHRPAYSKNLPRRPLRSDVHFGLEGSMDLIRCPVLFQYGENDILVDPVVSISMIPNRSNMLIKNYKNTDHSMNFENGDMNPEYLNDKHTWIEQLKKGVLSQ